MYDLSWLVRGTRISGDERAILRQQRSSRHYYQRPDANHVEVDSTRTSLLGYAAAIGHSRTSGEHWLWDVDWWVLSPGYEPNDLGTLGSADAISGSASLTYRETTPGRILRNYGVRAWSERLWNFGGQRTGSFLGLDLRGTLPSFWSIGVGIDYRPEVASQSLTRGGPLMKQTGFRGWNVEVESPAGSRLQVGLGGGGGNNALGGWSFQILPRLSYRPSARWEVSFEPEYRRVSEARQYVGTFDAGPVATFQKRYVFSHLARKQFAARIRLNFAIGPDLTLESYVESFASSGQYGGFGELLAPRGNDLRVYDGRMIVQQPEGPYVVTDGEASFRFRDPDFHVRSFRSNVVLRWEWRRGSTLFLVWQQDRSGAGFPKNPVDLSDFWDGLASDGDHYLAVKVTYWLAM
jgi:hypothetical protein